MNNDIKIKNIDNFNISIEQFKSYFLSHNYNENMFKKDGTLNPEYNSNKKTGVIAKIFEEHWNNISAEDKSIILKYRPNADKETQKIIDCHNKNLGCSTYICPNCDDVVFIGHTCKSRLCSSCGYKYKLERVENILSIAYNCKHRQIVFTCPPELHIYFFIEYEKMINVYFEAVNQTIYSIFNDKFVYKNGKYKIYKSKIKNYPGFFAFLHTYGRQLNWNPHIHILIAEIKLYGNKVKKQEYFNFDALSKRFMYILLDLMGKELGSSFNHIKNKLFKKYPNGFYVYAEKKKFKDIKSGIEYVTRYCGRVPISENRIINYDGENVTFSYNDHKDESYHEVTVSALQFIKIILRHLIPTNFKIIRYYGFYRKKHPLHHLIKKVIADEKKNIRKQLLKHRLSLLKFFNYDPYQCPNCGAVLENLCYISPG